LILINQTKMSAEPEETYAPNEPCLCYHLNLLYEARVLEVKDSAEIPDDKFDTPGKRYKVHYKGWKSSWDEYVPANRLLKTNETNMTLMKRLAKDERAKTGASSGPKRARESTSVSRPAKRMREEESNLPQPEMKLQVSDVLKIVLVDDWEMVKSNKLVSLPRSPNVDTLLKEFEEYVKGSKEHNLKEPELLAHTVVTGIRIYFDRTLGLFLALLILALPYSLLYCQAPNFCTWSNDHSTLRFANTISLVKLSSLEKSLK
jgi:mortality factor 4-like protein 1